MDNINWLGHAGFYFNDQNGNKIYFVDPFELKNSLKEKADIIFITHAHSDHFSLNDINNILKNDTIIVAPPDILEKINMKNTQKFNVKPNRIYTVLNFQFQTIPAYNTAAEKLHFHPKTNNWVGYIFNLNGKTVYHSGDTDFIDEMKTLKDLTLDVAMLCIGGTYTMDYKEAALAANTIAAKITIPMHYKALNPTNYLEIEKNFIKEVTNSKVIILPEN